MGYTTQTWTDNVTKVDAEHLNHMEAGIAGGQTHGDVFYGTCSTAYGTTIKAVTCEGFEELFVGAQILVEFSVRSEAASPSLNVNQTGAKNIWIRGVEASTSNPIHWGAGAKILFIYNGTGWEATGYRNSFVGSCTTSASTSAKVGDVDGFILCYGVSVTLHMTYANTNDGPSLNLSDTGGYPILGNTGWGRGDYVTFVFSTDTAYIAMVGSMSESTADGRYAKLELYSDDAINVGRLPGSTAGSYSTAEGYQTTASGNYGSHAEGACGTAGGNASHVEGGYMNGSEYSVASGYGAHAEGASTQALGTVDHAEGENTIARDGWCHVEGYMTEAGDGTGNNYCAHAEGYGSKALAIGGHAEGYFTEADAYCSHAEGYASSTFGYEYGAHAEGLYCTAGSAWSGYMSGDHAEGCYTKAGGTYGSHAEGYGTEATGYCGHAEGWKTTAGSYAHAEGCYTTANASNHACGHYNYDNGDGSTSGTSGNYAFTLGNGTSSSASNAFRITYAGQVYALSAFNSSGADYAEFIKEWADGNPDNEDRVGYFVTVKDGGLVKAGEDDYIVGITSGNPSVVGNADEDYYWRYKRDDFDRILLEDIEEEDLTLVSIPAEEESEAGPSAYSEQQAAEGACPGPRPSAIRRPASRAKIEPVKTGNIIENGAMRLSADYDASLQSEYVHREDRPEWDYVGMIGTLPVRDDGTCEAGKLCRCGGGGVATIATERGFDTYLVIERVTGGVVRVVLR